MYVCLCHGITERNIREAAGSGARSLPDLAARTGCGTGCGCCRELAEEILQQVAGAPTGLALYSHAA